MKTNEQLSPAASYVFNFEILPISTFLVSVLKINTGTLERNLYTVSKLLGQSSIKMTEIYAHLAPDTLQAAVAGIVDKEAE